MARVYKVSADMSEKEKAVGGVLTFGQAAWLALGFIISAGLFLLLARQVGAVFAVIVALPPGIAIGLLFAFYKKQQLPLATYLKLKHEFKKKSKQLVNDLAYGKEFTKDDELFQ